MRRRHGSGWRAPPVRGTARGPLRRLTQRLDAEGIPYALIGGMALAAYGFVRMTQDVDILMTAKGLDAFRAHCVGRGYVPAFQGAQKAFRDTETGVQVEIITTGEFPGDGKPKPVAFPDPAAFAVQHEGMWVIALEKLIEMKLASGMTAPHRLRDLADVQDVISALRLPEEFAARLDSSVRARFLDLWNAASPK